MKLLAIVPARNEEWILRQNLQVLTRLCDAVFVADQRSTDHTADICRDFAKVHYLRNDTPYPNPENRRQILLNAARDYDGCNVILAVDADEIITATALFDPDWLTLLDSLQPGDSTLLQWVTLWKDPRRYRDDRSVWADRWVPFLFRDNRKTNYAGGNWHESRVPQAFIPRARRFEPVKVLHYQFVAWDRMLSKQSHCRVLELLRSLKASAVTINQQYIITKDERRMALRDVPPEWIEPWLSEGIEIEHFRHPALFWYDIEILRFFAEYGTKRFAALDIWDIDWECKRQLALVQRVNGIPTDPICDPRNPEQKLYHAHLNRYIGTPLWRNPGALVNPARKLAKGLGLRREHLERVGVLKPVPDLRSEDSG